MIGIIGTGWLGKPLAELLIKQGYSVKGTTTSPERIPILRETKILPFVLSLLETGPEGPINDFLEQCTTLIINIPPGLRRNPSSNYVNKIATLIPFIAQSSIKNILYISSTSVFADTEDFPIITAETAPNATTNAGKQLIKTEELLKNVSGCTTTILRFGGLFGKKRHPAHMLSKRSNIKNPKAPVNLIHLEDCIEIISKIIEEEHWGKTYIAAYPDHPTKKSYYSQICTSQNIPLPDYDAGTPSKGKIISSREITTELKHEFSKTLHFSE